ncbi:MAG: methionine--tRNA ligase [Bacteroidia bacterium]|nr:methionine--tRNA ligase [Bacteroidia bacterium]
MGNLLNQYKRFTVTAALPYANGPLHIGHIAGAYLPADIYVRYLRLRKKEVVFICGSDEHGAAITMRAKKEGVSPQEIIDKYHSLMRDTFQQLGIHFDIYHRTSDAIHHETAQVFFLKLNEKNEFLVKESEQYFDEEYQQFLADRYIQGTCPNCGNDKAFGDQCEKCGSTLNPTDLINPLSTLSNQKPVLKTTKHWYLPLDKYQAWLESWILGTKQDEWKVNVFGQCKAWLNGGLHPRAMTRDLDWGVDVPLEEGKGKKLYVWLDAPIGYISATKKLFEELSSKKTDFANPDLLNSNFPPFVNPKQNDWEKFWKKQENPEDDACLLHFIGKDNIVFHCIIFPAILHAHGEYILPENVPGNEFLNLEGDKISTSRNWAVWVHEFLKDFPEKRDILRYVLCSILPETKDSEFTWADFKQRNDSELNAIFSNFIHRVLILTHKNYGGVVPDVVGETDEVIKAAFREIYESVTKIHENIEQFRFRDALFEFMNIARTGNRYLTETAPWKLMKSDPEEAKKVMFASLQIVAKLTILARVFLPDTAEKLAAMLNLSEEDIAWENLHFKAVTLKPNHVINEPVPLFMNIEQQLIDMEIEKLNQSKVQNQEALPAETVIPIPSQKEFTTFEDFQKMDIRIARILEAAYVPKSDKLLQFIVDTGLDKRTIVSGVAEHFKPEELVGKQVLVLMNLPPRKIRGVESHGMILYAGDYTGKLHVIHPEKEGVNEGSTVN